MARRSRKKKRIRQTPKQLLDLALRRIGAGAGKQALDLLKRAQFKGASPKQTAPLWNRAYALRAIELEASGLDVQASDARERAARFQDAFDNLVPSAGRLVPFLQSLEDGPCFALYVRYLRHNPAHREAEVRLADRLVLKRCWQHVALLDEKSQFRRDSQVMASAMTAMDRGDWKRACQILQTVAATSGFRVWRAFCVAMDANTLGDRQRITRALKQLPSSFPLRSSVKTLRAAARPSSSGGSATPAMAKLFGLGRSAVPRQGRALRNAVKSKHPARIGSAIRNFAKTVDPLAPAETAVQLALALERAVNDGDLDFLDHWDVFSFVGPPGGLRLTQQRNLVQALVGPEPLLEDVGEIAELLKNIEVLFPEPALHGLARSRILCALGKAVLSMPPWEFAPEELDDLAGIALEGPYRIDRPYMLAGLSFAANLYSLSVDEDPANTDAHKRLVKLLRGTGIAKQSELVAAYESYAKAVPEDPDPWIALAELRLRHNAYRKAQNALKKAQSYAGQDDRVIDLLALSSIVAADRNLRNRRFEAAERDILAAEARVGPRTDPLARAWRALLDYRTQSRLKLVNACERAVASSSPLVRAQAFCLALAACSSPTMHRLVPKRHQRPLKKKAAKAIRAVCDDCPEHLPQLVERLPDSFESVTSTQAIQGQLAGHWPQILRAVPDRVMFKVFLVAVEVRAWSHLRKELPRRLPRARNRAQGRILLLYLATVRYLLGEDNGGARFTKLVDSIPKSERHPVVAAAAPLADATRQSFVPQLSLALQSFNFAILDEDRGLF